jgi:pSer/pThr/pTyr-binding forkhead associated (FHA) protein
MRENWQHELPRELLDEEGGEWCPQTYRWTNSTPTVTVCVTKGLSVGHTHRLTKRRASIGKIGGGADMQIDDPEASALHCAVAITDSGIRLYDLDSHNGTYVDDVQIQVADLNQLSAFRIGSTEFVVSIAAAPFGPE